MSMAKIVVRVPAGDYTPLCAHVDALGKTLSERARELLLADMASAAPSVVPILVEKVPA